MSKEPIIVVHGTPAQGETQHVGEFPEGTVVFIDRQMDFLPSASEEDAAAYRELVETRGGTSLTDAIKKLFDEHPGELSDFGSRKRVLIVGEDRTGSIPQDMIEAMHDEVLRIQRETPMVTIVFDNEINDLIWPTHAVYRPQKERDWQQNQKRGRMKPRRR